MSFTDLLPDSEVGKQLDVLANSRRLPHALVLESRDSSLSKKVADELAAAFLCEGTAAVPCGKCSACMKVSKGIHPDVTAVSTGGKQSVGVGEIRDVVSDCFIKPNEGRGKFYLISDKMTPEAQNALLKILEEPPQSVMFVIVTEKSTLLLKTVLSRSSLFKLSSGADNKITDEAFNAAVNIVKAIPQNVELPLIAAASGLTKNRELMRQTLDQLSDFFMQALEAKYLGGKDCESYIADLSDMLKKSSLIKLIDVTARAQDMLSHNCNMNLLATWICAGFRESRH